MEIKPKNQVFSLMGDLLKCGTAVPLWRYDADGNILDTTANHAILDHFLSFIGGKQYMIDHGTKFTQPLIISSVMGLMWAAAYDRSCEDLQSFYVIGPVYYGNISQETIEKSAAEYQINKNFRRQYVKIMEQIPVLSNVMLAQFALMLHFFITGTHIEHSELQFYYIGSSDFSETTSADADYMQLWQTERALLQMVREGDLNYRPILNRANHLHSYISPANSHSLTHAIVNTTAFTTLCAREAIAAGIAPDTAYMIADSYIQSMMNCRSNEELMAISVVMYEDFITRVRKHRTSPSVSMQVQRCRNYIDAHADEELSLSKLAQLCGYSEYYLSRKFKSEMGVSLGSYIRIVRVERAKLMLMSTDLSVSKIAAELHFCSASHLSDVFKEITGKTPQQFRSKSVV